MSMSTNVVGIIPADEIWQKQVAAYNACLNAGVEPPPKLVKALQLDEAGDEPNANGCKVEIEAEEWRDDSGEGFEVDLRTLDPRVKILRFWNSW